MVLLRGSTGPPSLHQHCFAGNAGELKHHSTKLQLNVVECCRMVVGPCLCRRPFRRMTNSSGNSDVATFEYQSTLFVSFQIADSVWLC